MPTTVHPSITMLAHVMKFIASGVATKNDAMALAEAVLKSKDSKFARWTA